jgi:hypothetical protein
MDFLQYTINWTRGEIFEGTMIGLFGIVTFIIGALFWKFGVTPGARAMLIPLLVLGLFFAATGISMYNTNQKRIPVFQEAHAQDPAAFVQSERERVEGFQYLYTITLVLAPVCFVLATAFFWLSMNHHLRAVGIALVLFGLSGLVIDYFSKERADIYYEQVLIALEEQGDSG